MFAPRRHRLDCGLLRHELVGVYEILEAERLTRLGEDAITDPDRQAIGHFLLGHGHALRGEREQALASYKLALGEDASLNSEPGLIEQLVGALGWRTAAARELLTSYPSEAAFNALAERTAQPGPIGRKVASSILVDLNQSQRIDFAGSALADLTESESCEEKRSAVELLRDHPDPRALPVLEQLQRGGVARWFQNRCLRKPLRQAISAIEATTTNK